MEKKIERMMKCIKFVLDANNKKVEKGIRDTVFDGRPDLNEHFVHKYHGHLPEGAEKCSFIHGYALCRSMFYWSDCYISDMEQCIVGDKDEEYYELEALLSWMYNFNIDDVLMIRDGADFKSWFKRHCSSDWDDTDYGAVRTLLRMMDIMLICDDLEEFCEVLLKKYEHKVK